MKKIFNIILAVVAMTAVTSITSCTKTCDAGFEGDKCDTEVREKFVGQYKVSGTLTPTGGAAIAFTDETLTIAKSSSNVENVLFTLLGTTLTASSSGTTLNIESQTVNTSYTYVGNGSINSNIISFTLTQTDNSGAVTVIYNLTGSGPKQ